MENELISADQLHAEWMKDPKYRKTYDALEEEFRRASARIDSLASVARSVGQHAQRRSWTKGSRRGT